jgi:hypothetical protein
LWTLSASLYNYTTNIKKGSIELPTLLFGFLYLFLFRTNIVLSFQNPIPLVLISKDFDLIQWCNIGNLRNINDFYLEDSSYNVLTRYFMLVFTYQIRNFKTGGEGENGVKKNK